MVHTLQLRYPFPLSTWDGLSAQRCALLECACLGRGIRVSLR